MVEVGLYGNILTISFEKAGCLVTEGTWFKNLWEFLAHLEVKMELSAEHHNHPVREGGKPIMGVLLDAGFREKIAKRLNRLRKYKGILHLSDKAMCDGKSLDP